MVLGARQNDHSDIDGSLKNLALVDFQRLEEMGFPFKVEDSSGLVTRLKPWNERQCKSQLEHASRQQYNHHQRQINDLLYGFVIDMTSER